MKNGDFVLPGDVITDSDRYKAGAGTINDNGTIKALLAGYVRINPIKKEVSVKPIREPVPIKKDDVVLGEVFSVSNTIANIKIYFVYHNKQLKALTRPYSGTLHTSQIGFRVQKLSDYLKTGDIILAKVLLDRELPYPLTASRREYGVVAAYCGACGGEMAIKDPKNDTVVCLKCGRIEKRKLSKYYDYKLFTSYFKMFKPKHYETANV